MHPTRLAGAALLLAAGCSSYTIATPATPPVDVRAPVRADAAEICVLRLPSTNPASPAVVQAVHDNGRLAGATEGPGYFCYGVRPGAHRLTSEVGIYDETLDLVLAPGERRFVQQGFVNRHGVSLATMTEPEARAALPGLRFQQVEGASEPASSGAAATPLPGAPPAPTSPPRRRPFGMAFGAAAGLGLASGRTDPATTTTPGLGALASFYLGFAASDHAVLAARLDASSFGGNLVADLTLHVAVFPVADRAGPLGDLMIFGDGGARVPTSQSKTPGVTGVGRLGVGWERWKLGPTVLGPFLCGQVARGGGEADAALIAGIGASLYPKSSGR